MNEFQLTHTPTGQVYGGTVEVDRSGNAFIDYRVTGNAGWFMHVRRWRRDGKLQVIKNGAPNVIISRGVIVYLQGLLDDKEEARHNADREAMQQGRAAAWLEKAVTFLISENCPWARKPVYIARRRYPGRPALWVVLIGGQLMGRDGKLYDDPKPHPKSAPFIFQTHYASKQEAYERYTYFV